MFEIKLEADPLGWHSGWSRYMEWMHNVEVRWTNKKAFKAAGIAETAATL